MVNNVNNRAIGPMFVVDRHGNDVGVFASLSDVELQLEAIDVTNGEYLAYDAEGRLVTLRVDGESVHALAEEQPTHVRELKDSLEAFLKATGEMPETDYELAELVSICRKYLHPLKRPKTRRSLLARFFGYDKNGR